VLLLAFQICGVGGRLEGGQSSCLLVEDVSAARLFDPLVRPKKKINWHFVTNLVLDLGLCIYCATDAWTSLDRHFHHENCTTSITTTSTDMISSQAIPASKKRLFTSRYEESADCHRGASCLGRSPQTLHRTVSQADDVFAPQLSSVARPCQHLPPQHAL